MKKVYETPVADKINFDYENQVVASGCRELVTLMGAGCTDSSGQANDQA